jgi:excisionase family DNA binding protein
MHDVIAACRWWCALRVRWAGRDALSCIKHRPHRFAVRSTVYNCGVPPSFAGPRGPIDDDVQTHVAGNIGFQTGAFLMPEYFTLAECASRYRVSRWTMMRAVQDGRLSAVRVGRCIRVSPDALESFVTAPSCPIRPR